MYKYSSFHVQVSIFPKALIALIAPLPAFVLSLWALGLLGIRPFGPFSFQFKGKTFEDVGVYRAG